MTSSARDMSADSYKLMCSIPRWFTAPASLHRGMNFSMSNVSSAIGNCQCAVKLFAWIQPCFAESSEQFLDL